MAVRTFLGEGSRRSAGLVLAAAAAVSFALACAKAPGSGAGRAADSVIRPEVVPVTAAQVAGVVAGARGKVVLVNVWATWCNPCREEFPHLVRLQREQKGRGLELVLVSADFDNQLPQVTEFLAGQGVDFRTYRKVGSDGDFIDGLDPRWSGALPATFIYDRGGALRDFWEGDLSYEGFLERLRPWLTETTS